MSLLKTVKPEEATGEVAKIYQAVTEKFGMVPTPLQLYSASPDILAHQFRGIGYFATHPNLSPGLLALIRMLVAEDQQFSYCISLNKQVLTMMGVASDDQLAAIMADPKAAPIPEKEVAMLEAVVKACAGQRLEEAEVQRLRDLGWQDADIMDAIMHGLGMIVAGTLEKAVGLPDGAAC